MRSIPKLCVALTVICGTLIGAPVLQGPLAHAEEDWSGFRGHHADGVVRETELPLNWGEGQNVAWRVELPGGGWSQPVVRGGRVFVTCAVPAGEDKTTPIDAGFAGLFNAANRGEKSNGEYLFQVLALDARTGNIDWERTVHKGVPLLPKHRSNTFASETPVANGEKLVVSFGANGLACFDLDGNLVWEKKPVAFPMQMGWGTGSSPVIFEDRVFVLCDNDQESFIAALNLATGEELWRMKRQEMSNWSTPYLWRNATSTELVVAGGTAMRSYDPKTGDLLWEMKASGRAAMSPVGAPEFVCVDSADRLTGGRGTLAAVRVGAKGVVTIPTGKEENAAVAWSLPLNSYRVASPLLYKDCLYLLEQGSGVIRCVDATTGKLHYQKRLPQSIGTYASPLGAAGRVYCLDQKGLTVVLRAGPEFEILASNQLEDGTFGASAAVTGDRLLLRGSRHLYCISR